MIQLKVNNWYENNLVKLIKKCKLKNVNSLKVNVILAYINKVIST